MNINETLWNFPITINANAFFHIEEKDYKHMIKKNNLKVNCDSCGATHINKNNNNWTHLDNGEDICRKCIYKDKKDKKDKVNNKNSLKKVPSAQELHNLVKSQNSNIGLTFKVGSKTCTGHQRH
jgi:hypothetical protein